MVVSSLLKYLALSLGWLLVMIGWALVGVPYSDPRCLTADSFGFLPAAMVVPFLMLPLYVVSVVAHAPYAFRARRIGRTRREGVALIGADAAFFVPFAAIALVSFAAFMQWSQSLNCLLAMLMLGLPWFATPIVNARLLAWSL